MDKNQHKIKIISDYKTKLILILSIITVISLIAVGILTVMFFKSKREPVVTFSSSTISERISKISELAVNKIEYRDIVKYESGEIPVLTKKSCTMIYAAEVKMGIDFKDIVIEVNDNSINVTLPEAKILDIIIDENSLEFYDEKFAVFNWQDRYDTVELLKYAKENIRQKAVESNALNNAKSDARKLIRSVLEPMVEDCNDEIVININ